MKRPFLSLFLVAIYSVATAQQFSLIKDINPGAVSSNICYLTDVDNVLYFGANNGVNGMELWKSDGSAAGTVLVKDINAGTASSSIGYLTAVNRSLFFVANNGTAGTELWRTDGTAIGTTMVKDIRSGALGSNPSGLVNMNGTLYFAANNGVNGTELWKSDGTAAGTIMVKDINAAGSSYPQSLAQVNGNLFFSASNGSSGMELWKSDGTAAGTQLVKDIGPGSLDGYPANLVAVGGILFFSASDGTNGTELWKSDGTAAGTVLLKDIRTGVGDSYPFSLKEIGGTLFFSADNGSTGIELWKSNGTPAGTILVKDVWPGQESGAVGNFSKLINKLIFTGNDGVNGYKTWQSDGSATGTIVATDLANPGSGTMQELEETDNNIYASIDESGIGLELWGINYSSILPLELLDLKGKLVRNDGILNWTTANEINMKEFVVERSLNGINYNEIGRVEAAGLIASHSYSYTDRSISDFGTDRVYYRIKQNDIYDHYTYSRVIVLQIKSKQELLLYPVPANRDIVITGTFAKEERLPYSIIDNMGRIIIQQTVQVVAGNNNFSINIERLPSGSYYLRLKNGIEDKPLRFVKQ